MAKEAYLRKVQQMKAQNMIPGLPPNLTPEQQKSIMLQQYLQKSSGVVPMMMPPSPMAPGMSPVSMPSLLPPKHPGEFAKKAEDSEDKKSSIKDLTDVTRLAGVDVKLENARILGDQEDDTKYQSEATEPTLLNAGLMKKRMLESAGKANLGIAEDVYSYVALATQEHLREILQHLVSVSQQRQDTSKDELPIKVTSDVKRQLRGIEMREREEDKKRRLAGNERDDAAKRSRLLPTSEEEMQRNNTAALQAAGNVRVAAKTSLLTPPVFTHQHLQQLQQLQQLQDKGTKLDPAQLQKYQYLRAGLSKLHHYQQQQALLKTKGVAEGSGVVAAVPQVTEPAQRKIVLEDVLFSQKFSRCRTVLWRGKQKTAKWLL
jgi:spore germination cell wall hydrolase CwlJ-like protein